eukprot:TRINITY_DN81339_c0_g1_i2.p2 TRINITY_DN81339_c0_g1~~TRINITY_DN81339_c0_g1_i2.p2  ORF type:complete len:120 (-),score=14.70 TRINITY_DN81339_c0_g1_i2:10-369(-)
MNKDLSFTEKEKKKQKQIKDSREEERSQELATLDITAQTSQESDSLEVSQTLQENWNFESADKTTNLGTRSAVVRKPKGQTLPFGLRTDLIVEPTSESVKRRLATESTESNSDLLSSGE